VYYETVTVSEFVKSYAEKTADCFFPDTVVFSFSLESNCISQHTQVSVC